MGLTQNLGRLSNIITSTGTAVGIAQASPLYTLDVTGTGRFTNQLYVSTGGTDNQLGLVGTAPSLRLTNAISGASINGFVAMSGASNNYIQSSVSGDMCIGNQNNGKIIFGFGSGTATPKMSIDSSGNIGIGVTQNAWISTAKALQLNNTAAVYAPADESILSNNVFVDSGDNNKYITTNFASQYRQVSGQHLFYSAASGTAGATISFGSPKLSIASTGAATFSSSVTATQINASANFYASSAAPTLVLTNAAQSTTFGYLQHNGTDLSLFNTINGATIFATNNTERMRITSGGNVGIGTSSVPYKLLVNSNVVGVIANFTDGIAETLQISTGSGYVSFLNPNSGVIAFRDSTNSTERMRITSGGQLYINTSSGIAATPAQVEILYNGQVRYGMNFKTTSPDQISLSFLNSGGSQVGYIYSNNSITAYITTSDYRLKEDLRECKGLELVNKINIYDYKWKIDGSRMDGVLAHELAEIIPYAVHGKKDGESMQGVDYSKIVPILVKAIQEQQAQIEELKAKIK